MGSVDYLVVDEKINIDWSVVSGNSGLVRDFEISFPKIYLDESVDYGENDDDTWALCAHQSTYSELDHPLVFSDNLDGRCENSEEDYQENYDKEDLDVQGYIACLKDNRVEKQFHASTFSTTSLRPWTSLTLTCEPLGKSSAPVTV